MNRPLCVMVTSAVTANTFLRGYLRFLADDGWDVTLLCKDGEGIRDLVAREGINYIPLRIERDPSPLRDVVALIDAYRALRKVRPDVLVYATPKASLIGAVAGLIAAVPVRVYELWGLRLETAEGASRLLFTALERVTARLSTICIANSHSLAERAQELKVNSGKQVKVLGAGSSHGVDSTYYNPSAPRSPLDADLAESIARHKLPVVGYIGRLHPDKGIDTLLDALQDLAAKSVAFQLILVGAEEGADYASQLGRLEQLIPVHHAGYLPDVRAALSEIDILVLPSRREGFPNVVLEAAAMGVPAVVSSATGARDSVVDGVTGLVAEVDNSESFEHALHRMLVNEGLRAQLGGQAREYVVKHFSHLKVWSAHSRAWALALLTKRRHNGRR